MGINATIASVIDELGQRNVLVPLAAGLLFVVFVALCVVLVVALVSVWLLAVVGFVRMVARGIARVSSRPCPYEAEARSNMTALSPISVENATRVAQGDENQR